MPVQRKFFDSQFQHPPALQQANGLNWAKQSYSLRTNGEPSPGPTLPQSSVLYNGAGVMGENERPDEAPSPAASYCSFKSNHSVDCLTTFSDTTQIHGVKRMQQDEMLFTLPSNLTMDYAQSVDQQTMLNDPTQHAVADNIFLKSLSGMRAYVRTSPAPSYMSAKSDQSIDRPIVFTNETDHNYMNLISHEAASSAASLTSWESDQSDCLTQWERTELSYTRKRQFETTSPAPSTLSLQSHQSMDRPAVFKNENQQQCKAASPAPTLTSLKSELSMDRPIVFGKKQSARLKSERPDEAPSPVTSLFSLNSISSMDRPIVFNDKTQHNNVDRLKPCKAASPEPSKTESLKIEQSQSCSTISATLLTEDHYRCLVCSQVFKDPVSLPCGHSCCKHCFWSCNNKPKSYSCPQCSKRFRGRPMLNVNVALANLIEELKRAGFSPVLPAKCFAGFEDVACDICTERKLKAVKSCLTCTASYCETHVRQHYTVPALQRHKLVEAIRLPQKDGKSQEDDLKAALKERDMQAKRLCGGFEIHCIDFSDVIEMAALHHSLSLGMLYDSHSNSFLQDIMLEEDSVASMKVSLPRPQTCVKILECDSFQDRCRALDISSSMLQKSKSVLAKLSGAAAFLNHPEQSQNQDRVTLHYRTTTRLDMISQRLLEEVTLPSVINETTATHVIIGVCYGAQAVFVFDDSNQGISEKRSTEMKNIIKKITTSISARDVFLSLSETEKATTISHDCNLYIDMGDWTNPVSIEKALEIYDSLPSLLGPKGEKAVPLKVWLYPLDKEDKSSVSAAVSGVSENLHEAEKILGDLRKQIKICQDMITDCNNFMVIMWFPAIKEKLVQFLDFLQEYKNNFHRRIAESMHMIKQEPEMSWQHFLESHYKSPFHAEKTNRWLENKETELKILNDCKAADITVVKSQAELQHIISHPQKKEVLCLNLFSPDAEDVYLSVLRKHINCDHMTSHDSLLTNLTDVHLFIASKETNEDEEQTKFIAAAVPDKDFPKYSVQFYHAQRIVSRNVMLGTNPDIAQIVQIKHTSVSLKLILQQAKSNVRYVVQYRALENDGKNYTSWNHDIVEDPTLKRTCIISNLKSGYHYQLRYSVIENDRMSSFSKIIHFQTAVAATPGDPLVNKPNTDTLRVTWQKAEADEDCPVLHYMVEYKEAGLEGWSAVQTQGPECECTLTVPHSTCYRVRVSAVYEDAISKTTSETEVPVDVWRIKLSERKISILQEVLKIQTEKKPVELIDWTDEESEVRGFLQCLPYISELRFAASHNESSDLYSKKFILDVCLQAALCQKKTEDETVKILLSSVDYEKSDFLLDLYSHVKDYEKQTGKCVLPALKLFYQSAPAVWSIDLSQRKSTFFLEVLKLQTEKKPVELRGWTDEESEVREFIQCLPYISQLRFYSFPLCKERTVQFLVNLIVTASKYNTIKENYTDLLTSVCSYSTFPFDEKYFSVQANQCDFLLDLYSHVKDNESQTGKIVLQALRPVYQSAPAVWRINLSKRKSSLLLEVLKLQTEKKPVELIDWTDEESEVRGFIQCLPYISHLRFHAAPKESSQPWNRRKRFILDVCLQAAFCQKETVELTFKILLSSVNYEKSAFLLDLYSHVKDYESQTDKIVLPALQSVYQSAAPEVWRIDLSQKKSSILLEVLKLQTEKKTVELIDLTNDNIEVNIFLRCLPYISELRFVSSQNESVELRNKRKRFILDVCFQAALCQKNTEDETVKILLSSLNYEKSDFLLDLYSHVKDYEKQTGKCVLPALKLFYQSAPAVWSIDLSQRKSTFFLEVVKLQTEKKPVELRGWTDDHLEINRFLLCLPYISQLRFYSTQNESAELWGSRKRFMLDLCLNAALYQKKTIDTAVKILLSSVDYEKSDFLLDLCSHVKDYEKQKGKCVLPALKPFYQSAPAVWSIDLSQRKISILLEVLKLQTEKKPVELIDWTDEESEVRGFIQCLPYISELRFCHCVFSKKRPFQFLVNLIVAASGSNEIGAGKNYTDLLTSVCSYSTFPFDERNFSVQANQCDFLLDLCSHVKDYESQTGRSVLPALQPVYQSASPAVWRINLFERKSSILLEVLKLQTEKKPVELIDWTDNESEAREFLKCLPYISQLRNADHYFPSLCKVSSIKADKVTLLQALDCTITLSGKLPSSTCRSVGKVLGLSSSKLNLTLKPQAISIRGLKLLLRPIKQLQKLSVEDKFLLKMVRVLRSINYRFPLATEKLSLDTNDSEQNHLHILSSLTSLLRLMSVKCLDLSQCKSEALTFTALLCLQEHLTLRFSQETLQQLISVVYKAQDDLLTSFFLKRVSKDLTFCSLNWEVIHYLVQCHMQNFKLDLSKRKISCENIKEFLPWLSRIHWKRLSPSLTLSIIMEIYESRFPEYVSSLMSSAGNYINLNGRVLDSVHCAALRFTLEHCNTLKLNLLWTSIPEEELKSILPLFNRVTQLSVDRLLLLKLLHCCSSTDVQQEAAAALLSALKNTLDFSCSTALDLTDTEENQEHFNLSIKDSSIISSVLQKTLNVKLILKDCELSDEALKQLWPILPKVQLSCSKALLLQFLACISKDRAERRCLRSAEALSQALGEEMDLSHTQMDQRSCEQLAVFLEYSEGLTELDLSHCKLTDQCMEPLLPHLHKTQTLDLSHNNITDESANKIHSIVSNHSNIQTVRLFGNRINDRKQFIKDKRFEIW
nr:uncharacterized protein si:ch211-281l24.3 isoform X2 [Danio rerio]|eukprot:XP_005157846.1 uncharacterized protein si:ch211-281l24.3 isoform X2 [Danio rerio]